MNEFERLMQAAERDWSQEEARIFRLLLPPLRVRLAIAIRVNDEARFSAGEEVWLRILEVSAGITLVRVTDTPTAPFGRFAGCALRDLEGAEVIDR